MYSYIAAYKNVLFYGTAVVLGQARDSALSKFKTTYAMHTILSKPLHRSSDSFRQPTPIEMMLQSH